MQVTTRPKKRARTDEEALLIAMLLLLRQDTANTLEAIVLRYYRGEITLYDLADLLTDTLMDAHSHAVYLGRRLAGVSSPMNDDDRRFAQTIMAEQQAFLFGLISDIHGGKYPLNEDGTLNSKLVYRIGAYTERLRGSGNQAMGAALAPDTLVWWVLGLAEHCVATDALQLICTEIEAGNPYRAADMPTWPGMNETPCLWNCHCSTFLENGQEGF